MDDTGLATGEAGSDVMCEPQSGSPRQTAGLTRSATTREARGSAAGFSRRGRYRTRTCDLAGVIPVRSRAATTATHRQSRIHPRADIRACARTRTSISSNVRPSDWASHSASSSGVATVARTHASSQLTMPSSIA